MLSVCQATPFLSRCSTPWKHTTSATLNKFKRHSPSNRWPYSFATCSLAAESTIGSVIAEMVNNVGIVVEPNIDSNTFVLCLGKASILFAFGNNFLMAAFQLFAFRLSPMSRMGWNTNAFHFTSTRLSVMMAVVLVWAKMRNAVLVVKVWIRRMKKLK